MIPLRDNLRTGRPPLVTLIIIGINTYAFLKDFLLGPWGGRRFIMYYGLIPCSLSGACEIVGRAFSPEVSLFTSMFVHAGFFHFAGNMLYLWIFGNNVEDAMGRVRFVIFYLLSGLGAALAQILVNPASRIPMVGASGAISGVLGAYLLLFPQARVLTLIPLGLFTQVAEIPALVVLGFWIVVQLLNGLLTFNFEGGGVAFFAHIGGFVVGMLLVGIFKRRAVPWGWQRRRVWHD
ncbi:MAG TPA: rhomboid family intramembrane serine protease [Candidatus Methylomirabilis sp.]|nr:rhomboid family intramembrane serine protease [Candidatus Methylomirabilis sp.]